MIIILPHLSILCIMLFTRQFTLLVFNRAVNKPNISYRFVIVRVQSSSIIEIDDKFVDNAGWGVLKISSSSKSSKLVTSIAHDNTQLKLSPGRCFKIHSTHHSHVFLFISPKFFFNVYQWILVIWDMNAFIT